MFVSGINNIHKFLTLFFLQITLFIYIVSFQLFRWRVVVHGGIDGYYRIPVYLRASSDNKSETVLAAFLDAVNEYGLPSRVWSNKGGENVKVAWHMLNHPQRGPGRGSMVTGCYQHIVGYSSHKSKLDTRPEQQKCLFTKLTHFLFFLEIVIVASHFSLLCYNNLSLSCNSLML